MALRSFSLKIIFSLVCVFLPLSIQAETWRITSLDWQPYSASDMPNQGKSVQKLRDLLKEEGIELIVEFYPWKRAQAFAKQKEYTGYFPAWPEEVYEGFTGSDPVDWSDLGIMENSDSNIRFIDMDDLFRNYTVGIVSSYGYPESVKQAMKKYPQNVDLSLDEESLVKKLSAKRFDAALTDPEVMLYNAHKRGIMNVKVLVKSVERKALVVAFRNGDGSKKKIEILNRAIRKAKSQH